MEKSLIITCTNPDFWNEARSLVDKTDGRKGPETYIAWKILEVLNAGHTPLHDLGSAALPLNKMEVEYLGIGVQSDGSIDFGFGIRTSVRELTQKLFEFGLEAKEGNELLSPL
ncbi:MAG: hypothetical protein PHU04_04655 [Candidatus Peribacteraceae bacterium]|nr:hypothetical protein [Candidatus Peribacteraceae bacterium]